MHYLFLIASCYFVALDPWERCSFAESYLPLKGQTVQFADLQKQFQERDKSGFRSILIAPLGCGKTFDYAPS